MRHEPEVVDAAGYEPVVEAIRELCARRVAAW